MHRQHGYQNLSLKEAAMRLGLLSDEEFDRYVRPDRMVRPCKSYRAIALGVGGVSMSTTSK